MVFERLGIRQRSLTAEELQLPGEVRCRELLQEQPAEQSREDPDRQEEPGPAGDPALAIRRDAAAWHDDVEVWVVGQCRAPGVEHGGQADPGAEMLRVGRNGDERLGRRLEQQVVDDGLVLVGDVADRGRQREDYVEVWDRQQLGFPVGKPLLGSNGLALRAVAIAAGSDMAPFTSSQRK
jgi:hypothetical protein